MQVRRKGKGKQIWALEKMENRLVDMKELYQEWKDYDDDNPVSQWWEGGRGKRRGERFIEGGVNNRVFQNLLTLSLFFSCPGDAFLLQAGRSFL